MCTFYGSGRHCRDGIACVFAHDSTPGGSSPPLQEKPICAFFGRPSGCKNGSACSFRHIAAAESSWADEAGLSITNAQQTAAQRRRPPCMFHGTAVGCRRGDCCPFSHESGGEPGQSSTSEAVRVARPLCHHFTSKSGCRNGDTCPYAHERGVVDGSNVLFIGNLRRDTDTETALYEHFKTFGHVRNVKIKTDRDGRPRGFGFVVFADAESATRAFSVGHGPWDVKRKHAMDETKEISLDPRTIRSTHGTISFCFSNGNRVDDVIDRIQSNTDTLCFDDLPAIQVVKRDDVFYSLSNRRLFVARVLANKGLLPKVRVHVFDMSSGRTQLMKDGRTKWERSFSTRNGGLWVHHSSRAPCRNCNKCHSSRYLGSEWAGPRPQGPRLGFHLDSDEIYDDDNFDLCSPLVSDSDSDRSSTSGDVSILRGVRNATTLHLAGRLRGGMDSEHNPRSGGEAAAAGAGQAAGALISIGNSPRGQDPWQQGPDPWAAVPLGLSAELACACAYRANADTKAPR